MYESQKIEDTEAKKSLFREKDYLGNEKKPAGSGGKSKCRSWMSNGIYERMLTYKPECNNTHKKSKIDIVKIISGTILVRKEKQGYIIEQYSRGVECFFGHEELAGKNIFTMTGTFSFMYDALEKAMEKSLHDNISSTYVIDIPFYEPNDGVFLKVAPMLPFSTAAILITIYNLNSQGIAAGIPDNIQDDVYVKINNDNMIGLSNMERSDNDGTLHSYNLIHDLKNFTSISRREAGAQGKGTAYINEKAIQCLTKREREIAGMVLEGDTNRYISSKLMISEGTVKKTIHNTYRKLGVSSRIELVRELLKD